MIAVALHNLEPNLTKLCKLELVYHEPCAVAMHLSTQALTSTTNWQRQLREIAGSGATCRKMWHNNSSPAWLASQPNSPIGQYRPDEALSQREGDALQCGWDHEGDGVEELHALLLPKDWQALALQGRGAPNMQSHVLWLPDDLKALQAPGAGFTGVTGVTPTSSLTVCMCCWTRTWVTHLHFMTAEGSRCGQVKARAAKCLAEQSTAATQLSEHCLATDSSGALPASKDLFPNGIDPGAQKFCRLTVIDSSAIPLNRRTREPKKIKLHTCNDDRGQRSACTHDTVHPGQTWNALAFAKLAHSMAVSVLQCSSGHDDSVCRNESYSAQASEHTDISGTSKQSLPCSPKPGINIMS